jgi:hypothetical protein
MKGKSYMWMVRNRKGAMMLVIILQGYFVRRQLLGRFTMFYGIVTVIWYVLAYLACG